MEFEQQIADYLQQHPDFFLRHLDLLDQLQLHHTQKGTISLVEMQLARQRDHITHLETLLDQFHQLAHQQQDIFYALMPLQHKLSQARTLVEGIQALDNWAKKFELQQAKILLFRDQWSINAPLQQEYWLDRKAFELIRLERFGLRHFYLGELTHKEKTLLFLPEEFPLGSVACCLLGAKTGQKPTALLLFSARDTRHFHNGQDTTLLKHLVDIVRLHLNRWLDGFQS